MKHPKDKIAYIRLLVAIVGSFFALVGGDVQNFNVWNMRGPMQPGDLFLYAILVLILVVTAPCGNKVVKWIVATRRQREERKFHDAFKNGQAKRVKTKIKETK